MDYWGQEPGNGLGRQPPDLTDMCRMRAGNPRVETAYRRAVGVCPTAEAGSRWVPGSCWQGCERVLNAFGLALARERRIPPAPAGGDPTTPPRPSAATGRRAPPGRPVCP